MGKRSPTGHDLRLDDPKLASVAVGGRLRIGDLDGGVLTVLQTNFGIGSCRTDERNIRLESVRPR